MTTALKKLRTASSERLAENRNRSDAEGAELVSAELLKIQSQEFTLRLVWSLPLDPGDNIVDAVNPIYRAGKAIWDGAAEGEAGSLVDELHKLGSADDESRDYEDRYNGMKYAKDSVEFKSEMVLFTVDLVIRHQIPVRAEDIRAAYETWIASIGLK